MRKVTRADALKRCTDTGNQRDAVGGAHGLEQTGRGIAGAQVCFYLIKVADLAEHPTDGARAALAGLDKPAPCMRPAPCECDGFAYPALALWLRTNAG